jgi:uncharacterized protein
MATDLHELPLFPLNMVLYPHARVQLHVFEMRYRQMIRKCLDDGIPFGVVLIRSGEEIGMSAEPYMVGTAVRIEDIFSFPDGRYDVTVTGTARFRIRSIDESLPYLTGKVEFLHEDPPQDEVELFDLTAMARRMCEKIIRDQVEHLDLNFSVMFPEEPDKLSFAIANMIELPLLQKQMLLETTDTMHRLTELVEVLRSLKIEDSSPYRKLRATDLNNWISSN